MIKYLGCKRRLLPQVVAAIRSCPGKSVLDLFSGTAVVSHALKREGYDVIANDLGSYAHVLAQCYVEGSADRIDEARTIIQQLNTLEGKPGWFTDTYAHKSRFFQEHNAVRIDVIRDQIQGMNLDPVMRAIVLTSLMEAADKVDSTVGLQMAYLKTWAARSYKPMIMKVPDLLPGHGIALHEDARVAAQTKADIAYLDPPYNQHSYLGNYHIWESLVLWDKPEVYGVACKRVDVRERKSPFNSKRQCVDALCATIQAIQAPSIVLSFSDEGYVSKDEIIALLEATGRTVKVQEHAYRRHVGSDIGKHNPSGERTGAANHRKNVEYIFTAI